jgi:hypothetical protein
MRWWRQADPRKKQRIRGAAYAILACTAAFALLQVLIAPPSRCVPCLHCPPTATNMPTRLQAQTWHAAVKTELRRADAAKMLAANPTLQQEALELLSDNFARPFPPDYSRRQGLTEVLVRLKDKYTRVINGAGG